MTNELDAKALKAAQSVLAADLSNLLMGKFRVVDTTQKMILAYEAAKPKAEPVAWQVKPLEWGYDDAHDTWIGRPTTVDIVNYYTVAANGAWSAGTGPWIRNQIGDIPGAMAAAQADHDVSIISALVPAAEPTEAKVEAASDLLAMFGEHINWDMSTEGDEDEIRWVVHQVTGFPNDREWTPIGTGDTPAEAIRAALLAASQVRSKT